MKRNIGYWGATGLVAIVALLGGFSYVTNSPEAIENFRHVGYPQQLRVLLGIAKLAGASVLLLPRLPTLKEWAYAGFTFTWIAATVAHYLAQDGLFLMPGRVARGAGGVVRDAPGESPRFRDVDAATGRPLDHASGVRAATAASAVIRRSSCPTGSRERRSTKAEHEDARASRNPTTRGHARPSALGVAAAGHHR